MPKVILSDAVMTFRQLSHSPNGPWLVPMANGQCADAIDLLLKFYEAAKTVFKGRDTETDDLLKIWFSVLQSFQKNQLELVGKIDWITKRFILEKFMEQENLTWNDPWLKSQDLEFHHIDPSRSLGLALAQTPPEWNLTSEQISAKMTRPPSNTRAGVRSRAMELLRDHPPQYFVDWEILGTDGGTPLQLLNPFDCNLDLVDEWQAQGLDMKDRHRKNKHRNT
jgi:proteasome accessory factor A